MRPSYQSWFPGTANSAGGSSACGRAAALGPLLVGFGRRRRVDLVAAHHEQGPPRGGHTLTLAGLLSADVQLLLREEVGKGVRRVETVSDVADVVDPHLLWSGVVVELRSAGCCLHLSLVGVGAEHG